MVIQSLPKGQHIPDWPSSNGIQIVESGQQKFGGRRCPHTLSIFPFVRILQKLLLAMAKALVEAKIRKTKDSTRSHLIKDVCVYHSKNRFHIWLQVLVN